MSLRHVLAAASVLLVTLVASACSNQGEGERCDRQNNDDDCQEGLVCKSQADLGSSSDTCCPPGEGSSDLPECTRAGGSGTTASGTGAASTGVTVPAATVTSSSTGGDQGGGGSTGDGGASQGGGGAAPGSGGAGGT